jgi:hypothetical protein
VWDYRIYGRHMASIEDVMAYVEQGEPRTPTRTPGVTDDQGKDVSLVLSYVKANDNQAVNIDVSRAGVPIPEYQLNGSE